MVYDGNPPCDDIVRTGEVSGKSYEHKSRLLTGAFLSMGLMMNFLSLNEMFLISLQGNPILGVNLKEKKVFMKS